MASMIQAQNNEIKALNQLISSRDTEIALKSLISGNDKFCGCLLRNITINGSSASPTLTSPSSLANIPNGYDASCNPIGGNLVSTNNRTGGSNDGSIDFSKITISDLVPVSGDGYFADIVFEHNSGNLIRPLKPIKVKVMLNMNSTNLMNQTLNSCGNPNPIPTVQSPGDWCGSGTRGSRQNDRNPLLCFGHNPRYSCPVGYYQAFVGEADYVYSYTCIKN